MIITKNQIKKLMPCAEGWAWYLGNPERDLLRLLQSLNRCHQDWAKWLYTNLMTHRQRVQIAVFSAELLIGIYEEARPGDERPRKKINEAKAWLNNPTETYVSYAAIDAAYTAAADASYASSSAANAASYAAYTSYDKKETDAKIIKEAVRILEETECMT